MSPENREAPAADRAETPQQTRRSLARVAAGASATVIVELADGSTSRVRVPTETMTSRVAAEEAPQS